MGRQIAQPKEEEVAQQAYLRRPYSLQTSRGAGCPQDTHRCCQFYLRGHQNARTRAYRRRCRNSTGWLRWRRLMRKRWMRICDWKLRQQRIKWPTQFPIPHQCKDEVVDGRGSRLQSNTSAEHRKVELTAAVAEKRSHNICRIRMTV